MFPMFPVIFVYFLTSQHHTTHTHTPYHTHFSLFPLVFSVFPHAQHRTTYTIHNHTHSHTCTPATDRYLARGLSKSVSVNARKNPRKCLKKAKSGETLAKARGDADGQIVRLRRSGERPMQPSSSWFPLKFLSFFRKKRMIRGLGHASFSTYSQTLKWARSCANSR